MLPHIVETQCVKNICQILSGLQKNIEIGLIIAVSKAINYSYKLKNNGFSIGFAGMKKFCLAILVVVMALVAAGPASAAVYTFAPSIATLNNLDHFQYFTWGIRWTHTNERIVDAVLTFHDIWNWDSQPNNLYSHLLNTVPSGVYPYLDMQGGGDNFAGQGYLVGNWTDPVGGHSTGLDLTYRFSNLGLVGALNTYASDGRFGFGFDPDCHYYNRGITLTVITASAVPEPATLSLFGLGLAGLGLVRRRK